VEGGEKEGVKPATGRDNLIKAKGFDEGKTGADSRGRTGLQEEKGGIRGGTKEEKTYNWWGKSVYRDY